MSYKLIVIAQYSENYAAFNDNWDGISEGWKAKGGSEFVIDMTSDERLFLCEEEIVSAIRSILAKMSNNVVRYEYVSHEFQDADMPNITAEFFEAVKQLA